MGQHGRLQRHGPGTGADIPDHMARPHAQERQGRGAHRLFGDQRALHGQFLRVQAQMRLAGRPVGNQQHGAGRAEGAVGRFVQAQLVQRFVGRAHAFKNTDSEPVHTPVQQMTRQHIRGHAGVGEDAERRAFACGRVQRPRIVAPVQGKADDLMPRQGQPRAGLLQRTDRRDEAHGRRAQMARQCGPYAEKERIAVSQQQNTFPGRAHLVQTVEQGFQRQGQRQRAGLEALRIFKGRQQFPAAAQHVGLLKQDALFGGEGRWSARAAAIEAQHRDGRGGRHGRFGHRCRKFRVHGFRPCRECNAGKRILFVHSVSNSLPSV